MTTKLPLDGLRVIEIGSSVAAPYGTLILAELGAEVIKVERPEVGDDARHWGPPFWHGSGAYFQALNRNKKSITVDMRDDGERARLRRLILETADVVVQNMRPGHVEKLGLSADDLLAEKPELIYCNVGAYGAKGPLKDLPGYDPLMQAFGGIMSLTGEDGRPPVRVGTSIVDMGTGMWVAIGVITALYRQRETKTGGRVDTSLYETALGWMNYRAAAYQAGGELQKREGSGAMGIAPYQAYECADGYLVVAAGGDTLFVKLAEALGHPEWVDDPRFATNPKRYENIEALNAELDAILGRQPRAHWQQVLDAAGVPNAPIQTMDEVVSHPQTAALDILQPAPDKDMQIMGLPISFDGERPPYRRSPPEIGEDNQEVFGDDVFSDEAIEDAIEE